MTSDGLTRLQHARKFARTLAPEKARELLSDLEATLPPAAACAAVAFAMLSAARTAGMSGVGPITLHDVSAYATAMRVDLTPRDVTLVLAMDAALRDEVEKEDAADKAMRDAARRSEGGRA